MGAAFDVWVQGFAPGSDPVPALQELFGIDERMAVAIQQTVPRAVKRGASAEEAEAIAAGLRGLGAKVELRPARQDARSSGTSLTPRVSASALPLPAAAPPQAHSEPPRASSLRGEHAPPSRDAEPAQSAEPWSSGSSLDLAFDPEEERARTARRAPPRPVAVAPPPDPTPAPASSSPGMRVHVSFPPWLKGAVGLVALSLLSMGVRFGLRAMSRSVSHAAVEVGAGEDPLLAENLASSVDASVFLDRPGAMLGRDQDRNAGLARELTRLGAPRVLASDIGRISGGHIAMTLLVELPTALASRRRIAAAVESYYANDMPVAPGDVEVPGPEERYLVVELD